MGEESGRRPSAEAKTVDVCGLQQALVRQRLLIEEARRAKPGEMLSRIGFQSLEQALVT
jgi:hypothetical protein